MSRLRSRKSRPNYTYARLGGYGVVWHIVADGLRLTPGRVPENVTVCGRVVKDGVPTTFSPPWPLCQVCQLKAKQS